MSPFSGTCAFMAAFSECATSMISLWAAVMLGILIGWTWRPRWISSLLEVLRNAPCDSWNASPGLNILKSWRTMDSTAVESLRVEACCCPCPSTTADSSMQSSDAKRSLELAKETNSISSNPASSVVGEGDLLDLHRRVYGREGGLSWNLMLERSAPGITYQAWRRDPQDGPTEYKSRTIFEDSSPELVKDFYWDDEFRSVWDDMLIYAKSKEDCMDTGAEIVHWVRKFPFFCSDREYLIGRRIFEVEGAFYCISKAVPYADVPRRDKPLRVDVYYSSWSIRAAESTKLKGQWTACEVMFFHTEDMHIPKNIAKFGVRQGMWGCVKKMEPGLRMYQAHRDTTKALSKSARMAQLYTRMPSGFLDSQNLIQLKESFYNSSNNHEEEAVLSQEVAKGNSSNDGGGWKWAIMGGAVILACTLDRGIFGRAVVVGLARKFGRVNQRLR